MKSLLIFALMSLTMLTGCFMPGLRPVPLDVAMAEDELFFVLEKPKEIERVYVTLHLHPLEVIENAEKKENKRQLTMWAAEYVVKPGEKKKYPELEQMKYGREIAGFETVDGPFKLEKNVKYKVHIEIYGREFASEIFYITDDKKAVMPDPTFSRQRNRAYSVTIDKNGDKKLVLEPVSK